MRFWSGLTRSGSQPGISWSSISTTVTREPSASYTAAISSPMIPPPITSSRLGIEASSRAPVESKIRGSSGSSGRRTDSEPAAMMQFSKEIVRSPTSSEFGPRKRASPWTTSTWRCLARASRPPVSFLTTDSFQPRRPSMSIEGRPNLIPCAAMSSASAIVRAAWSSVLEGMQPTFRQTPPSRG